MILVATETGVNSLRRKIKLPKSKVERVAGQARAPKLLILQREERTQEHRWIKDAAVLFKTIEVAGVEFKTTLWSVDFGAMLVTILSRVDKTCVGTSGRGC